MIVIIIVFDDYCYDDKIIVRLVYKDWFSGTPTYINTYIIIIKKFSSRRENPDESHSIILPVLEFDDDGDFLSLLLLFCIHLSGPTSSTCCYYLCLCVCVRGEGKKWGFKLVPVDLPCLKSLQQLGLRLVLLFGLWRSPPFFSRVCAHNQPTTLFYVYMFRSCAPQLGKGSEGWFPGKDRSGIFFFSPFPSPTFFPLIFLFLISFC